MAELTLTGRVLDARNQPVENATVLVVGGAGSFPELAAQTDAEGRFVLFGLDTPGAYEVLVVYGDRRQSAQLSTAATPTPTPIRLT